jgi:hypothetical protein
LPGINCWFCGKFGKRVNHSHTMVCHCGSAWVCEGLSGYDARPLAMMNMHTNMLGGKVNNSLVYADIASTNYTRDNRNSNYPGEYGSNEECV